METTYKDKGLIWGLLESASDHSIDVRETVAASLCVLGEPHPGLVLSAVLKFISSPQTAPKAQVQANLYNTAEAIVRKNGDKVPVDVINEWIKAAEQLLIQRGVAQDLQDAASNFLIALGYSSHCTLVCEYLVKQVEAASIPHQSIVETLASLASCNVNGVIPFIKPVLSHLIPQISLVKQDNLKQSLSLLFSKFSETILDAIANKKQGSDLSIDQFSQECGIIYESMVNLWLRSTNPTVRNESLLALAHMSHIITKEKLNMLGGVVVTTIIGLYRKNSIPFTLTFSLSLVTGAILDNDLHESIKLHVDSMLMTLFNQVCIPPNYSEPLTVKNHCEVLRCYEILAKNFPEVVMLHILARLENASHVQRVGALIVSKHLINSKSIAAENIVHIVHLLPSLLIDPNSKVVKSVTQVIVALCHNNHLDPTTGAPLITYLVKHCSGGYPPSSDRRNSLSSVGEETVGEVCSRALNLLATTMSPAIPILWPHMLTFVCGNEHEGSLPTVLSCLSHLSSLPEVCSVIEGKPLLSGTPGSPAPALLLTRLLVLCSNLDDIIIGNSSLLLLKGLAPHISPKVAELWDESLPDLIKTFGDLNAQSDDSSKNHTWQESLRKFLADTITTVKSEEFTSNLGVAQMEQVTSCDKHQGRRGFLMSLLGITLKHSNNKTFIAITLDSLFNVVNHKSSAEQDSFALALGLSASIHTDLVLTHLDSWLKTADPTKKSLSFFSLIKQQDPRIEEAIWVRSSVVLCLGQIASLAPPLIVGSKVDGPIMLHLLNIINSNKSDIVNDVIIQTTSKIAKSLLLIDGFKLRQRPLLITHLVNTIQSPDITLLSLANTLQALRDLTALEPILNVEERTIILQASLNATLQKLQENNELDQGMKKCYSQLNVLLRTIIQRDTNPAVLDDITTLLHSWTISSSELVRTKSLDLMLSTFNTYYLNLSLTPENPTSFNQTCHLLAMLIPRVGESNADIRSQAVGCCLLVLRIAGRYLGDACDYSDEDLDLLKLVEKDIANANISDLDSYLKDIGRVISNKLTFNQIRSFLDAVISGLQDKILHSGRAVAVVLSTVFTLRGHQLHQHIKELLDSIYSRLERVTCPNIRFCTVDAITNLASHNINLILDTLLNYPLPYEKGVCETWQKIGCSKELCETSIQHIIEILEKTPPFSEQLTAMGEKVKIATLLPLASISALTELLRPLALDYQCASVSEDQIIFLNACNSSSDIRDIALESLPKIVVLSLLLCGCYVSVMAPLHQSNEDGPKNSFIPNRGATNLQPTKQALECLRAIINTLDCPKLHDALSNMLQGNEEEHLDQFLHNINIIITLLVEEMPQHISAIVNCLNTHHPYEMQSVTMVAIYAQLVTVKCGGNYEMLYKITDGLLSHLNDKSVQVRRLAIRGLANFARIRKEHGVTTQEFIARPMASLLNMYCILTNEKLSQILSALVAATDSRESSDNQEEEKVPLEALRGLAAILPHLPQDATINHTPTLLIRIRLFSEKSSGDLRDASFGVLRGLALSVGETEDFQEHLHLHLIAAVMHLLDPHKPTVVMCKSGLQALGPHLGSDSINELFQNHLLPSGNLIYPTFIKSLTKFMAKDMEEHVSLFLQVGTTYFRSNEPELRRAAVIFVGHLVSNISNQESPEIKSVSQSLLHLLRDQESSVRKAATIAIPLFQTHHNYL